MSSTTVLFANYTITQTTADQGRLISFGQDWIGIGVRVDAVTGAGAAVAFKVQWSNDNTNWADDPTPLGSVTAPGTYVHKFQILALYWRLTATVTGAGTFTCSAGAIY